MSREQPPIYRDEKCFAYRHGAVKGWIVWTSQDNFRLFLDNNEYRMPWELTPAIVAKIRALIQEIHNAER